MHSQLYESSLSVSLSHSLAVRAAEVAKADRRVIGDMLTLKAFASIHQYSWLSSLLSPHLPQKSHHHICYLTVTA